MVNLGVLYLKKKLCSLYTNSESLWLYDTLFSFCQNYHGLIKKSQSGRQIFNAYM